MSVFFFFLFFAQIKDDQEAVGVALTELVESDMIVLERAIVSGRITGGLTDEKKLELSGRLAESSFRLSEHRRAFEKSK